MSSLRPGRTLEDRPVTSPTHPRSHLTHGLLPRVLWFPVTFAAAGALISERAGVALPAHLVPAAAVAVTSTYAWALANRIGGRPLVSATVALALGVVAELSDLASLVAGMAVATAVLAALLAVMETVPARDFGQAVREVLVATALAGPGALAVPAFTTGTEPSRLRLVVLGAAVLAMLALVSGLGAGLHGLDHGHGHGAWPWWSAS